VIGQLLDAATRRVRDADMCVLTDRTLSVTRTPGTVEAGHRDSVVTQLRLEDEGRRGVATRADHDVGALVEAAMLSARLGPEGSLLRPLPSPLPAVMAAHPGVASLDARDLSAWADALHARLDRQGRVVHTWAERSVGRVEVANTRGVMTGYDATLAGLGLSVAMPRETGLLALRLHAAGVAAPDEATLSSLAIEAEEMLRPPLLDAEPPVPPHPVWLAPRALAVFLAPLRQALLAHGVWSGHGPFGGRVGDRIVSDQITLIDDALAPGRPGSRPIDDDGVVTHRKVLIERGILRGALADLEAAARFGVPSTGHARRGGGSRPWIGWSNVVLEAGTANEAELFEAAKGGVLVRDFDPITGNVAHGRVTFTTPWAYKIEGSRIVGRYPRFVLRCATHEMLNKVLAVGSHATWIGAHCLPNLVIDS
jgi:PmbA protein